MSSSSATGLPSSLLSVPKKPPKKHKILEVPVTLPMRLDLDKYLDGGKGDEKLEVIGGGSYAGNFVTGDGKTVLQFNVPDGMTKRMFFYTQLDLGGATYATPSFDEVGPDQGEEPIDEVQTNLKLLVI